VLNHLVRAGREAGFTALVGEYLPTEKNGLVKDHYASLGFSGFIQNGVELWRLKFADFVPRPNHIKNN
jgi:predicted enzyme involved in methoxymalonyl-ACP biosynthesis